MSAIVSHDEGDVLLERIRQWQNNDHVHPLTCGTDSSHFLVGQRLPHDATRCRVILVCPDCDYRQDCIPRFLLPSQDPTP